MATQIIKHSKSGIHKKGDVLRISEFFCDTIQGEGITAGTPAAFLRLTGCTLNCSYCDTTEIWKHGSDYTFDELFILMRQFNLPSKLQDGQHLVITGGSPLLQQKTLAKFFSRLYAEYNFFPFIEMENECTIMPSDAMVEWVDVWNNSPKLNNSQNIKTWRYKPTILRTMRDIGQLQDSCSWFKFVIHESDDWKEIEKDFLDTNLIYSSQIILMPEGATRKEIEANREFVVNLAIENNVRYCTREHIVLWDNKIGV